MDQGQEKYTCEFIGINISKSLKEAFEKAKFDQKEALRY